MTVSFAGRVHLVDTVLLHEIQGETMFLNPANEQYFGLDEMGTQFLRALVNTDSIQSAYLSLLDQFDVEGEQLRVDLQDLIDKLVDSGLVEVTDG